MRMNQNKNEFNNTKNNNINNQNTNNSFNLIESNNNENFNQQQSNMIQQSDQQCTDYNLNSQDGFNNQNSNQFLNTNQLQHGMQGSNNSNNSVQLNNNVHLNQQQEKIYQQPSNEINPYQNINSQSKNIIPAENKKKSNRKSYLIIGIIVLVLIISLSIIGLNIYKKALKKQNSINSEVLVTNQLWNDYKNGKLTTDEYVRNNLYVEYDSSLLDKKYLELKKSEVAVHVEELVNKYYEELSEGTLNYFAKKITLGNITFETEKENDEATKNNRISLTDLFVQKVYAKSDKTTNLNKAVLSKNGNFIVWYTTTGDSATDYESAVKIANGLENTIYKYDMLFKTKYNYDSNIMSKGTTYKKQQKVLQQSNINSKYLETAMQIYLVNYNDNSLAQYISGYGKTKEILNSVFGGDNYGVIAYPYIVIKPSSFTDFERLEQLYNHELFHHYQHNILCGNKECNLSQDPYYADSTANWASSLVTNKTSSSGFLNEWANVYRYNSNSLLGRYINEYGESNAAYAMFVYLYNFSSITYNGTQKIIEAMYKPNFLEYLEKNSTIEERKNIQKEIAIKNLTLDYSNNNLNIPIKNRTMSNINDAIVIKQNDVYMKDVGIGKMGITYFNINLKEDETVKITIDKDNNYIDAILVAKNENDDYVIVDSSNDKGNQIIFDTNNYQNYQKFYLIVYNNNLTLQNYYSLTIKGEPRVNNTIDSNQDYVSVLECCIVPNEGVNKLIYTYYFDNNSVAKVYETAYWDTEELAQESYDTYKANKFNVKKTGNAISIEKNSKYFQYTRDSIILEAKKCCQMNPIVDFEPSVN